MGGDKKGWKWEGDIRLRRGDRKGRAGDGGDGKGMEVMGMGGDDKR